MVDTFKERRKFHRHTLSGEKLFVCTHDSNNLLAVKNISADGLQFVYFPSADDCPDCRSIDIMQDGAAFFCVAGVCCRIVYDISFLSDGLSFSGLNTRMAGVEFIDLTEEQQEKLARLIQNL